MFFVIFFFYCDGVVFSNLFYVGVCKFGGELGEGLVEKVCGMVIGVMFGIVGIVVV